MRMRSGDALRTATLLVAALIPAAVPVLGQEGEPAPRSFTLEGAVGFALAHEPAIRAASEEQSAAGAGVALARTSYLPRLDGLWQTNLATRNNISGLLLPQAILPSISGPVLPDSEHQGIWGNAGGLLLSWEPFDWGARKASLAAARGAEERAAAEAQLSRLEVATAAADGFMTLAAAEEEVRAAKADVDRREVFMSAVRALVDSEMRPGADLSRAEAELAAARIRMFQAESSEEVGRTILSRALGIAGTAVEVQAGPLLGPAPDADPGEGDPAAHPAAAAGRASVEEQRSDLRVLARSYAPRFDLQSAAFGRSSGAHPDGTVSGGFGSLALDRTNWAVGLTITFPLLDFAQIGAKKGIQASDERAAEARYDRIVQEITAEAGKARARWESARKVAGQTPVQLEAARTAERQTLARYRAGLGTVVEVADAERLLTQAEIDDSLARLGVWRGLLQVAAARGNLRPFLQAVRAATPGGP